MAGTALFSARVLGPRFCVWLQRSFCEEEAQQGLLKDKKEDPELGCALRPLLALPCLAHRDDLAQVRHENGYEQGEGSSGQHQG